MSPWAVRKIKAHCTKHLVNTVKTKAVTVEFFSSVPRILCRKQQEMMEGPGSSLVVSADCVNPNRGRENLPDLLGPPSPPWEG